MKFWGLLSTIILYKDDLDVDEIAKREIMRIEIDRSWRDGILCSRWIIFLRILFIELKRLFIVSNRSWDSSIASLSMCRFMVILSILVSMSYSSFSSIFESAGSRVLSISNSWRVWSNDYRWIEDYLCLLNFVVRWDRSFLDCWDWIFGYQSDNYVVYLFSYYYEGKCVAWFDAEIEIDLDVWKSR